MASSFLSFSLLFIAVYTADGFQSYYVEFLPLRDFLKLNLDKTTFKPYVRLQSTTPPAGKHPAMLVCSVYDFYPKQIRVSWTRDGQEVTSDVTSTDEMADGDWYYQIHSHLEYTPRSGEKISCVVEHASLKEPLVTDWDPSMPESERNKIAIGASVLILGLILSLAGFIYYRRKAQGQSRIPSLKPVYTQSETSLHQFGPVSFHF
ncbi:rano class II histocompatibility antigen, A beta chain-like [Lates calcarifer]|uniref:Rano class II histocompatibility antigen, A beta chain-like n=1 Tax=Lates calcarifer TaxID=8187 RepID=A0AAJ8DJK3_LATCA|nr:rano class II histocompatibility antigen, A beta chain-like [Lates calcarifer]